MLPIQKKRILDAEGEMEGLRKMFKAQVQLGLTADPEQPQRLLQGLDKDAVRALIVRAGHKEVSDQEIDAIFKEMDADSSGLVDIDEFMTFVLVADKLQTKDPKARDAVFNIRKAHLKLNAADLLEMFSELPPSFVPSFSQHQMENRGTGLPAESV